MNKNRLIARDLLAIAKELIAGDDYEYKSDPEHKHKPQGGGWVETEKGWSRGKQGDKEDGKGNKAEGNRRKQTYKRTDELQRVLETSLSMSDSERACYHDGSKRVDEALRRRLETSFRKQLDSSNISSGDVVGLLNPKTGHNCKYNRNISPDLFHDVLSVCQAYLKHGDCVDVHSSEDYKDCKNYLSEDGLSGFSITPEGDLISVFNLSSQRGFLKTIAPIVKQECKTLDCFDSREQHLPQFYENAFNFKTAAILDFNYDVLAEDKGKEYADYFVKTYGEAPVHFMVNSDEDVEVKHFNKDQWEEAKAYQQAIAFPKGNTKKTSSLRKPINMPWRVWFVKVL